MYFKTPVLLSICITYLCCFNRTEEYVMPYQQTSPDECDIDPVINLKDCKDIDGKATDLMKSNILPGNTSCTLIGHHPNESFQVMCRDGMFIMYLSQSQERTMKATSRLARDVKEVTDLAKSRKIRSIFSWIGDVFCSIFCSRKHSPPPNKPPTIAKRAALLTKTPVYANEGKTSAIVTWKAPIISDQEEGTLAVVSSPSNYKSGHEFSEGSYVVYFVATDKGGLSATEYIYFEVKVHRCGFPRWPENGYIDCENNDVIFGTKCRIRCKSGYSLEDYGTGSLTCGEHGAWTPQYVPDCKPISCERTPQIPNGKVQCLNNKVEHGSICEAVCNDGFQVRGLPLMGCDTKGEWGSIPECKDVHPPRFSHCPDNMQVFIDSPNNTAMVSWDEPEGQDNSNERTTITEIHGYHPGQRFVAGSYTVQYSIEDNRSNKGDSCSFSLKVLTLSCSPPSLGKHLKYDCPDSYRLGAECTLACKSGYPKAGANKIQCLRDSVSYHPKLEWNWKEGTLAPFCKITNCSRAALKEPLNGALACSEWTHGQMCQMQCNNEYDIPSYNDGLFVCGRSTGSWRPSSYVPNCNMKINVNNSHLPNDFYYYTAACNSSAENLNEIKENFVKMLNTSKFLEECVGVPECQAKFVNVTCGLIPPPRVKRNSYLYSTNRGLLARAAYVIRFDLILPYEKEAGKRPDKIFTEHEEVLSKMSARIHIETVTGHFDMKVGDLYVKNDSYSPGVPSLECPDGTMPRIETASCAGCPKGHYATEKGRCKECPFGTYQNSSNSMTCERCPPNTNTTETSSENITQCLEYCDAGEFSPTKLAPCTRCPSNSFQPNTKSETCVRCQENQRTPGDGAIAKSQCQAFDIQMSTISARIKNKETHDVITLFMWIYIRNAMTDAVVEIIKSTPRSGLSVTFAPTITVKQSGNQTHCRVTFATGHKIPVSTWTSVALSIDKQSQEVKLYINGEDLYENLTFVVTSSHVLEENDFIELYGDMKISAFSILHRKALPAEIASWSSTCSPTINGTIISSDDLADAENVKVVVPSVCDGL